MRLHVADQVTAVVARDVRDGATQTFQADAVVLCVSVQVHPLASGVSTVVLHAMWCAQTIVDRHTPPGSKLHDFFGVVGVFRSISSVHAQRSRHRAVGGVVAKLAGTSCKRRQRRTRRYEGHASGARRALSACLASDCRNPWNEKGIAVRLTECVVSMP